MPEVIIEVNARQYRMACEDGQESHVLSLARKLSDYVESIKAEFREAGDTRLVIMSAIMVLDEMTDLQQRVGELETELKDLSEAGKALSREQEILESEYAARFNSLAERIHGLAGELDKATANGGG